MSCDNAQEATVRETVQGLFQLLGAGDADRIADVFAEEIDWYVPGDESLPWTGHRTRRQQVPEYFKLPWSALVPGRSVVEFNKLLVDGDDAVWLGRFTHTVKANNRTFSTPVAFHLTVENGKIVRLHLYEDTHVVARAIAA